VPNFRHIGTLHNQYAIFENKEGMVLMSPRAARERIIYERLQASNRKALESQQLLVPELIELDTRDMGVAMEVKPQLEQAGFQLSPFGRNTLRVEAIPALLPLRRVSDFVQELLHVFTSGEVKIARARSPFEPFARQLARQYALQEDIAEYLQNPHPLLAALLECEIPYCSPGGKSTLLPFSLAELNRKFQA
jgi:DNA mismatch repair protein MutL